MKFRFGDFLFWVFLVSLVVLVLWRVFGDSPTETTVFGAALGVLFMGVFNMDRRVTRLEEKTKHGFDMMKKDMGLMKGSLDSIKTRLEI